MTLPGPHVSPAPQLRLSELLGALSHALDMTEGQPEGHCVRCCWIGMHVGRELGLNDETIADLFYTLLLKDLGCSSNAARICRLYLTDDLGFKGAFKQLDGSLPAAVAFVIAQTGRGSGLGERLRATLAIFRNGGEIARELIETRCDRGATIARRMRFSPRVADGIRSLDEHWDGGGRPDGLSGAAVPIASQIALLAQVADVFHQSAGREAAFAEVRRRSGTWFSSPLVAAFERVGREASFWTALGQADLDRQLFRLEPARSAVLPDEDYLDDVAHAFADVIDAKSPFTSGHSTRVALYTDLIAETLGVASAPRRWLRRGALLHDIGKLGVSNAILDKPGKLDAAEWAAVRRHAAAGEAILGRIGVFSALARMAGAHHERLDGAGYPAKLRDEAIGLDTRILTTADIFDALTAERPYRTAMPLGRALGIMREEVGTALDPACFDALTTALRTAGESSLPGGASGFDDTQPIPAALLDHISETRPFATAR